MRSDCLPLKDEVLRAEFLSPSKEFRLSFYFFFNFPIVARRNCCNEFSLLVVTVLICLQSHRAVKFIFNRGRFSVCMSFGH